MMWKELLEMIQPHIPTLTIGIGLVVNIIVGSIMDKKIDSKTMVNRLNNERTQEQLNDTRNTKAVLKIAKQHEDRLSRMERRLDEVENKQKKL